VFLRAEAVTQPQETRTLAMLTGVRVLLTRRNGWVSVGPRGTEPKSFDSSSNRESAHVAAGAEPTAHRPTTRTRLYRSMSPCPCSTPPARLRVARRRRARARGDSVLIARGGGPVKPGEREMPGAGRNLVHTYRAGRPSAITPTPGAAVATRPTVAA